MSNQLSVCHRRWRSQQPTVKKHTHPHRHFKLVDKQKVLKQHCKVVRGKWRPKLICFSRRLTFHSFLYHHPFLIQLLHFFNFIIFFFSYLAWFTCVILATFVFVSASRHVIGTLFQFGTIAHIQSPWSLNFLYFFPRIHNVFNRRMSHVLLFSIFNKRRDYRFTFIPNSTNWLEKYATETFTAIFWTFPCVEVRSQALILVKVRILVYNSLSVGKLRHCLHKHIKYRFTGEPEVAGR